MIHLLTASPLRSTPTLRFHRCRLPLKTRTGQGNRPGASAQDSPGDGNRRRGRPAHLRSPTDSPLRDGNRDRLIGLLTKRSAVTLCYYLMETNINLHHWLVGFMKAHPIPQTGSWEDVSGDTFLRRLLSMETVPTKWSETRDPMFDCVVSTLVDPRNIAQRIMTIRTALAREFIQDLKGIEEENNILLRETLTKSLLLQTTDEE